MAKETFDRSKPHVNIGTIGHTSTFEDTAGALLVDDTGSETTGNPAPSSVLAFSAPASVSQQTASVAFPIDEYFVFDPTSSGIAESLSFQLDVLSSIVGGTSDVEIAFAIIQDEPFVAALSAGSVDGTELDWTIISQTGLRVDDFIAVDGGPERPDFSRPFQFGYAFTGEYSSTALSVELGLDNMQVEITTVPEPSTILLAAAMGATLLWSRWFSTDENQRG
jgi:hypothetical protein